ncbi:hypothetical protein GEMRC1_013324 [Eukaryota sp. GEM-RC1]
MLVCITQVFSILDGLFLKLDSSSPSTTCSVSLTTVPALLEPPFPLSLNFSSNPNDLYYFLIPFSGSDFVHVQTSGTSSVLIGNGCPLRSWTSSFQCQSSSCSFLVPNSLSSWVAVSSTNHEFSITISFSDDVSSNCTTVTYLTVVIALTCLLRKCMSVYFYADLVIVSIPFLIFGLVLVGDLLSALLLTFIFLLLVTPYASLRHRYWRYCRCKKLSSVCFLTLVFYPLIGLIWKFGFISAAINLTFGISCYQFHLFFLFAPVYVLIIRKLFTSLVLDYRPSDDYISPFSAIETDYSLENVNFEDPVYDFQVVDNSSSD